MSRNKRCYTVPERMSAVEFLISESSLLARVSEIAAKPLEPDSFSSKSDSESDSNYIRNRRNHQRKERAESTLFTEPVCECSVSSLGSEEMSDSERVIRGIIRERKSSAMLLQKRTSLQEPQKSSYDEKEQALIGLKERFSTVQKEIIGKRERKEQMRQQLKRDLRKMLEAPSERPKGHNRWKTQEYVLTAENDSFVSNEAYERTQPIPQFHEAETVACTFPRRNRSVSTYVKMY